MNSCFDVENIVRKILFFNISKIIDDPVYHPYIYRFLPELRNEEVTQTYFRVVKENMVRIAFLKHIMNLSIQKGFEPVIFKGMYFIYEIYKDPGAKAMGDIDLLIDSSRYKSFLSFVNQHGFVITNKFYHATEGFFVWKGHKVNVDIHLKPVRIDLFSVPIKELLKNKVQKKIDNTNFYFLSDIQNLILFFVHTIGSNYGKLLNLSSMIDCINLLCKVINSRKFSRLTELAEQLNLERLINLGLCFIQKIVSEEFCSSKGIFT